MKPEKSEDHLFQQRHIHVALCLFVRAMYLHTHKLTE